MNVFVYNTAVLKHNLVHFIRIFLSIGIFVYRAYGQSGFWPIGILTIGLLVRRDFGQSGFWFIGIFVRRDFCSSGFWSIGILVTSFISSGVLYVGILAIVLLPRSLV